MVFPTLRSRSIFGVIRNGGKFGELFILFLKTPVMSIRNSFRSYLSRSHYTCTAGLRFSCWTYASFNELSLWITSESMRTGNIASLRPIISKFQ